MLRAFFISTGFACLIFLLCIGICLYEGNAVDGLIALTHSLDREGAEADPSAAENLRFAWDELRGHLSLFARKDYIIAVDLAAASLCHGARYGTEYDYLYALDALRTALFTLRDSFNLSPRSFL